MESTHLRAEASSSAEKTTKPDAQVMEKALG
jgi:hypothetical protein